MGRAAVLLVLMLSACGGTPAAPGSSSSGASGSSSSASSGSSEVPWWRLSRWSREADFETWTWGEVRPGPGLLGADGLVLWRAPAPGSADPRKDRRR